MTFPAKGRTVRRMNSGSDPASQPLGSVVEGWKPPASPDGSSLDGRWCRLERLDAAAHGLGLHTAYTAESRSDLWTYLPYGPFPCPDAYGAWIRQSCTGADPLFYAVVDRATGQAVGLAAYLRIKPGAGTIEIGHLCFSPGLQQTPAATEVIFLMVEKAFELGYRRVEWKCDALNDPSRRAAERFGFVFEGIFRQATVVKGRNRDTAWYAVLDREWPPLRDVFRAWLDPANFLPDGTQRSRLSASTAEIRTALERSGDVEMSR